VTRALQEKIGNDDSTLTQLILSSHSPAILRALAPVESGLRDDAVYADVVTRDRRNEPRSRVSRFRKLAGSGRLTLDQAGEVGAIVSPIEIAEFEVLEALDR
jgi:hypothetical protein